MRTRGKVDANHKEIVTALRKAGCTVQSLAAIGAGCPDVLIGTRGRNVLLEIKSKGGTITGPQETFIQGWRGQVAVVYDVDSAFRACGLM